MLKVVSDSKNLAAAGNYAAEDVMSEDATAGTPFVFDVGLECGYVVKAQVLLDVTALTPRLTLYLFNDIPSGEKTDNESNDNPIHADINIYEGKIDFPAMEDLGGDSESLSTSSTYGNLPITFEASNQTKKLYGILVTRDTITGEVAAMECIIKLTIQHGERSQDGI